MNFQKKRKSQNTYKAKEERHKKRYRKTLPIVDLAEKLIKKTDKFK